MHYSGLKAWESSQLKLSSMMSGDQIPKAGAMKEQLGNYRTSVRTRGGYERHCPNPSAREVRSRQAPSLGPRFGGETKELGSLLNLQIEKREENR